MSRPRGSGYEALPAHDEIEEDEDAIDSGQMSASLPTGSLPARPSARGGRSHSRSALSLSLDTSALDAKLSQWHKSIKKKLAKKHTTKPAEETDHPYEIIASVFAPVEVRSSTLVRLPLKTLDHSPGPMTHAQFNEVVEEVKSAIQQGIQPKLNKAGSSGSYFVRNTSNKTVGIFKPKDEEPYGSLNPKWTKWFHRNILSIVVGFGRACLLPNFSYLSEAGASLLSDRLYLYIVPPTELASLSSPAFFYDYIDRRAYQRKDKPLPEKIGSLQLFMNGYKDAGDFLKEHPWPGRPTRDTLGLSDSPSHREKRRNWTKGCRVLCGRAGFEDDSDSEDADDGYFQGTRTPGRMTPNPSTSPTFAWTQELMADFRLELEKLVILDVLMRNTDRGLDNFMVKICNGECHTPSSSAAKEGDPARLFHTMQPKAKEALSINGEHSDTPYTSRPHVHLAAIDNSLSWPVYHPNNWRSYSYGWLYLPSSLIGHPFSKTVRDHFLPILTDPKWWSQTVFELRTLFSQDADFSERMFKKQIAVFKGQAYNVVQSLRNLDEGPLELCRRKTCIVHDDEVAMADDSFTREMIEAAAAPLAGIILQGSGSGETSAPIDVQMYSAPGRDMSASLDALVRPIRSSSGNDTTAERPHYNRTSTYISQRSRPIPVSQRVDLNRTTFGGASGFALMEHMERVEKRERDAYPGMDPNPPGDDEEEHQDVWTEYPRRQHSSRREAASLDFSRRPSDMPEGGQYPDRSRMPRRNTLDISISERASVIHPKMKTVIVERLEETNAQPFFNKF